MNQSITVAITGMNTQPENPGPGLAVARSIREADDFDGRIIGLSYDALDPGLYIEQYCDASYLLPYPALGERELLNRIETIQAKENIDVLIPCMDSELPILTSLDSVLQRMGIRTLLPTPEQLKTRDKDRIASVAQAVGVSFPETKAISNPGFFDICHLQGWHYPFVVKGIFYDAYIVKNPADGEQAFAKIAANWGCPVLVQRLVKGEEYNLTAVGDGTGNMFHPVMMKKLGLTEKGKSWAGISIIDQTLLDVAKRLFKALSWRGPIEIETIREPNGKIQLIEINPRFPAWVYLSVGVGRNLPKLLLDLILKKLPKHPTPVKAGIMILRYAADITKPISDFEKFVINGGS